MLADATRALGGLTTKVDREDVAARADTALAALRVGNEEEARRYLAYTGAGHGKDGGIDRGEEMVPPACGDAASLPQPDDVVVVQFAIRDDGATTGVQPIFASRPGPMIRTFLEAVAGWSWRPEAAAAIRPFFRTAVRVELRCSVAAKRPEITDLLTAEAGRWFVERGLAVPSPAAGSAAASMAGLRAELARREAADGAEAASLLPVMSALIANPVIGGDEAAALAKRAEAIARATKAPASVLLVFGLATADRDPGSRSAWRRANEAVQARLAADPVIAADPRASAALRLLQADLGRGSGAGRAAARSILTAVSSDARLSPRDPMRVAAEVRLASLAAADKDFAAAQAALQRSGLEANQCALVDARPAMTSVGLRSEIYPAEAMRWGFEGWVQAEFDVAADGRTRNIRTVVGYPPFVFGQSTATGVSKSRFTQTYRPGGELGCGGNNLTVRYHLPG